jgi:hypothetical protein
MFPPLRLAVGDHTQCNYICKLVHHQTKSKTSEGVGEFRLKYARAILYISMSDAALNIHKVWVNLMYTEMKVG